MKKFAKINYRKIAKWLLYVVAVFWIIVGIMEVLYRIQIFDFYAAELNFLNKKELLEEKPAVLVFGDSFSADTSGWISEVRQQFPAYRVINSSIPGTGPVQANLIAKRRFRQFQPKIVIYQVYVGNDLFDMTYPYDSKEISILRKGYWFFSSHIRVLNWLNYKSGQLFASDQAPPPDSSKIATRFDADYFSSREKLIFKAEPEIIQNHVQLLDDRKKDFKSFVKKLKNVLGRCENGKCQAFVVVIPHCAQMNENYIRHMGAAGARTGSKKRLLDNPYPFYSSLENELFDVPNVTLLNPLDFLRDQESHGKQVYFANDIHLNQEGQKLLGEWVANRIAPAVSAAP